MEFFGEGDGEGSGELELDWSALDAEFFVEFAECGLQGLISGLDVTCGGGVEFAGEGVLFLERFWSKTSVLPSFWRMIQM